MSSESVSEAFAAIFMRWCMAAHIVTVTAQITAFCKNGGPCDLSSGKLRETSQWISLLQTVVAIFKTQNF